MFLWLPQSKYDFCDSTHKQRGVAPAMLATTIGVRVFYFPIKGRHFRAHMTNLLGHIEIKDETKKVQEMECRTFTRKVFAHLYICKLEFLPLDIYPKIVLY